jgi:hypothetical protein
MQHNGDADQDTGKPHTLVLVSDLCAPDCPVLRAANNHTFPGPGEKPAGGVCAGGAEGRVGGKAFDQMAGELEA